MVLVKLPSQVRSDAHLVGPELGAQVVVSLRRLFEVEAVHQWLVEN